MFGFFKKFRPEAHTEEQTVLVLDIGTEFVKCLIYRVEERHGFVTGYAKVRQKLGDMTAGTVADIAGVTANCEQAMRQASKMAGYLPEQAVLGIAGELVRGHTIQLSYTREHPTQRIDMPELRSIVQRVQQQAFTEVRTELARETGHTEVDVKLAHAAIIDTRIDSAHIENPLGFQGAHIELSVFNAFAPLVHFGALQTIAAELELDVLTIAAEPYAVARSLMTDTTRDISAIIIDVGGGTTDIGLIRGGRHMSMKMFALGGRTYTKRLAQTFNTSHLEAERIKLEYTANQLDARTAVAVRRALAADIEIWLAGVELSLSEMAADTTLPARIYLCGGGARLPEIKTALESTAWQKSLPFTHSPSVRFLCPDDMPSITDETGTLRSVQDITPLALANLGLELAGEESVLSGLLRQAIQLVRN